MTMGNKYGAHRVIEPKGLLPQAAQKINNNMDIYDNEILIDVSALNIDSASFHQLWAASEQNEEVLRKMILDIVNSRGKMQNPVTGSGGMLMGTVEKIGPALKDRKDIKEGDRIASLVSLSLTPLRIDEIIAVHPEIERVDVKAKAILFESGIYAKLPADMPEPLALAALDVAGAPAQTAQIVKPGDSVLILGAGGKSGMLCAYEAMKRVGPCGNVVGMSHNDRPKDRLLFNKFVHKFFVADAQNPVDVLEKALAANDGKEYDVAINVVNIEGTEMSTILPVRDGGLVYFFSMATSFTRAALGAEGVGKDLTMIIGNGYTKNHAEITLEELRESKALRDIFEKEYV